MSLPYGGTHQPVVQYQTALKAYMQLTWYRPGGLVLLSGLLRVACLACFPIPSGPPAQGCHCPQGVEFPPQQSIIKKMPPTTDLPTWHCYGGLSSAEVASSKMTLACIRLTKQNKTTPTSTIILTRLKITLETKLYTCLWQRFQRGSPEG